MYLGTADFVVFGLTLLISILIGVYFRCSGGKQQTNQEYLLGNKNQGVIPIAFSLVASFASSISILGYTSEVYNYGTHFFVINVAYLVSTPTAAIFYLPVLFKNNTISVYEYLEKRFGHTTRLLASMAFTLQMILYMGVVHYAPAIAVEAVTGFPQTWSIICIGIICIFYGTIGGVRAVIITDLFQTLLMFAAVFAIIIVTAIDANGFEQIYDVANAGGRIQFSNFNIDPTERHSWFTVLIGGFFTHITLYAINQAQVQRYVSMKSYKSAATALMLSCPILIAFMSSLCLVGLCLFYYYRDCDPIKEGRIKSADQLVPRYVLDRLNGIPGLTGLFVAGIFSASLSTVSAAVNSLAAVTLEDYVKPAYKYFYKTEMQTLDAGLTKFLALTYGFVCLAVALLIRNYESLLTACFTVFGVCGGPLFALFTAGMMIPAVNELGAIVGFLTGLVFCFVMGFGGPKPKSVPLPTSIQGCVNSNFTAVIYGTVDAINNTATASAQTGNSTDYNYLFKISYMYYIVLGFGVTLLLSILVSLVAGQPEDSTPDPDLFTPLVARHIRNRLRQEETVYMYDMKKLEELEKS
ncbi:putative sodium-dependent multivitamin transporter [Planococcus citri]|uniref:putative sodium-dependent multivitamin transporter n=1 Tax=Planococcus citri TaxID=170843 RepID=UPI0031F86650